MQSLLAVGAGGALGAVLRYLMASQVGRWAGSGFPWGTLAVNLLGALLIGLIVGLAARFIELGEGLRLFLVTGVLGGFTTFSAFSLEVGLMIERQQWMAALAYVAVSVIGCVALVLGAMWLLRQVPA